MRIRFSTSKTTIIRYLGVNNFRTASSGDNPNPILYQLSEPFTKFFVQTVFFLLING